MTRTRLLKSLSGLVVLTGGWAWSAEPAAPSPVPSLSAPAPHGSGQHMPPGCPQPVAPGQPQPPAPGQQQPQQPGDPPSAAPSDAFAQAPEAGTQPAESFNPNMFGDLIGPTATRRVRVPGKFRREIVSDGESSKVVEVPVTREVRVPVLTAGGFKIAENESPRPVDRAFITYNFFNNVFGALNPGVPSSDLHRQTVGFERTFFDRSASFGIRLPFLQLAGFSQIEDSQIGDLSFLFKYALVNDPTTGQVLAGGLAITAPTGEDQALLEALDLNSTLLQPWAGFIYNLDGFYVHGFSSLVVPTNSRDVTIWFNDVGVGLWAYRTCDPHSWISAVVPTFEVHVNTPLNHRGSESLPIGFIDSVDLTGGFYCVFRQRCFLGAAVAVPVTGPQPFDVEALANLNIRF